jgi:hypothetical protein
MQSLSFEDRAVFAGLAPFGPASLARRQATGAAALALALAALTLVAALRPDANEPTASLPAAVSVTAASAPVTPAVSATN